MPHPRAKTLVKRLEHELRDFLELYHRDKPAALFLILALAIYGGILGLPQIPRLGTSPTMASPRVDLNQAGYPAKIHNRLENSVPIAVGGDQFQTLHAGAEMPVDAPRAGTAVRIYSCGWGDPPCKELAYGIFPGQRWEVTQQHPYPRVVLIRSK